eukprot:13450454-Alexandrium_andersonii.AAC.1
MVSVDIKDILSGMDCDEMKNLKEHLVHDKSTNDRKINNVSDMLSVTKTMTTEQHKIDCARQLLKNTVDASI